jgi:hypothetical protein
VIWYIDMRALLVGGKIVIDIQADAPPGDPV